MNVEIVVYFFKKINRKKIFKYSKWKGPQQGRVQCGPSSQKRDGKGSDEEADLHLESCSFPYIKWKVWKKVKQVWEGLNGIQWKVCEMVMLKNRINIQLNT